MNFKVEIHVLSLMSLIVNSFANTLEIFDDSVSRKGNFLN